MKKPEQKSKRDVLLQSFSLNSSIAILITCVFFLFNSAFLQQQAATDKAVTPSWGLVGASLVLLVGAYVTLYEVAYRSLDVHLFSLKKQARYSAYMFGCSLLVGSAVDRLIRFFVAKLIVVQEVPHQNATDSVWKELAGALLFSGIVYLLALRRTKREKSLDTRSLTNNASLKHVLKSFMIGYGVLAGFTGSITNFLAVNSSLKGTYWELLTIPGWVFFLSVYYFVLTKRQYGSANLWRVAVPAAILFDIFSIYILTNGKQEEALLSLLMSLPLYASAIWYAYSFASTEKRRQNIHKNSEQLFK